MARLAQVELSVTAWAALVEPLVPADQTEPLELLAALELVAQVAKVPCVRRTLCATQVTSR